MLPPIPEILDGKDGFGVQDHISGQWKDMVTAVETLKSVAGQNCKYETELDALGSNINCLKAMLGRIESLLGSPKDGFAFDLFAIMDGNEEIVMERSSLMWRQS
jgi:hypothetical protein